MQVDKDYDGPLRDNPAKLHDRDNHYKNAPIKLKKWLMSRVGKNWSDVYSELCAKFTSPEDRRFIDRDLPWFVNLNVYEIDGKFHDSKGDEVTDDFFVYNDILCKGSRIRYKYRELPDENRRLGWGIRWVDGKIYGNAEGVWYELIIQKVNPKHVPRSYKIGKHTFYRNDIVEEYFYDQFFRSSSLPSYTRKVAYGDEVSYCAERHQLNKTEIKRLNLKGE